MSLRFPEIVNRSVDDENAFLSRAASYNNLPDISFSELGSSGLRRTFSDLTFPTESDSPSKEDVATGKDILRRTSLRSKNKPTIAVSRFTLSDEDLNNDASSQPPEILTQLPPETRAPEPVARPSKARSMSGRLVNLARKPWMSSNSGPRSRSNSVSRSPSPPPKSSRQRGIQSEEQSSSPSKGASKFQSAAETDAAPLARKRTILNKRPRRPTVALVTQRHDDTPSTPTSPSPQSIRNKNSLERLTASLNVSTPVLPPMPRAALATIGNFSVNVDPPRKKDELWGIFRGLEADYQKFQSKSSSLKANVIRSSLLPFLNRNNSHASYKSLRPEDLDRRVNILNKWWIGLLEMLNGKHNQSISGTDRPVYLEAVVGIMTRPEWRVPFPMPPSGRNSPNPLEHASTSVSDSSEGSSGSDFLIESIHHNIKNIFVQNLLSQMAFVVDRMSMRHAPASLVAFCGKACAYAFFFCPGVADILVRLWNPNPIIFRRILAESGLERSRNTRSFTQDLALNFPTAVRSLAFNSHTSLVRYLRQKPDVPLSTAQIRWQSPWVSRWCGRDTDLFFVFIKYIHILYADVLPPDIEKAKRILAPGLLPIHAQLLVVLEDTLYKQSAPQIPESNHTAAAITFDDFIEGADASISSLPLGAANSHRSMAENRLVILLRDLLSESSLEPYHVRLLYAESFCSIMKTAVQRTSLFDHNACFLLCDFVEEVIPILTRYSQSVDIELFDWEFWLEACHQMMQSNNSLTEVRVFSFLFCTWNTWVASEERKEELCLRFLLNEAVFYHYFSHWSPMVRAYFHRLLCWRLGRFNGEPSPLDTVIYETLSNRLQRIWSYYLTFQSKAEEQLTAPLSSAPCTPAPGRRIIIIRCDNQITPANLFVSFDRVVPPSPPDQTLASKSNSSSKSDSSYSETQPPKRRWNVLKAMFGNSSSSKPGDDISPRSSSSDDDPNGSDPTIVADKCLDSHWQLRNGSGDISRLKTPHQPFSFKFSLEWMDRPQWPSKNKRLFSPSLPVGAQVHLQLRKSMAKSDEYETTSTSEYMSAVDVQQESTSEDPLEEPTLGQKAKSSVQLAAGPGKIPSRQSSKLPVNDKLVASKYAGRALAEWAQIVSECDGFFARRRDEGVPCDRMVETPTLGVEGFRK